MANQSFQLILTVQNGPQTGITFQLAEGSHLIGRTAGNQIVINESTISKQHARLTVQPGGVIVEDLDSSNGTFVNGQRISSATPLRSGDILQVGTAVVLGVQGPGGAAFSQPAPAKKGLRAAVLALVILLVLGGVGAMAWFVVQSQLANKPASSAGPATAQPIPTETPTATPVPPVLVEFSTDKTSVQLGRCVTLRWSVENAKEVRLDGEQVSETGTHKACPQEASKTYRLTALSVDGETEEQAVTITVPPTPAPPPGVEIEFTADQLTVSYGDCTTLRWRVKNANEVRRGTKKVALVGTEQVCPTEPGTTYTLLVQTLDGENIEQAVSIIVPPTPEPTNTPLPPTATLQPSPQNPIIDKFIADQNSLSQGSCTTLRWQVRNAQSVQLDGSAVANTGSKRVCPTASTNSYNLVAIGTGGGRTQSSLTIAAVAPTSTPAVVYVQPSPVYAQPPAPAAPSGPPSVDAWVTIENDCIVYGWSVHNVKEVYFDGEGVTGQGKKRDWCFGDSDDDDDGDVDNPTLRVVYLDGRVEEIFVSDAPGSPFWRD